MKQRGLTAINILGLSIGLACFCMFTLYAIHEFSFDKFHKDADQLYRVYRWTEDLDGEGVEGDTHLPMPLGTSFASDFPDVEQMVRWKSAWGESFVRVNDRVSRIEVSHVDQPFFEMFNFPIIYGDSEQPLSDPKNVVLTEEIAFQLFGEENPTGKTIEIQFEENFESFTISAVAKNIPTNSSRSFQILGSMDYFASTTYGKRRMNSWNSSFLGVFVKLRKGSGLATNAAELLKFRRKYYPNQEAEIREAGFWDGEGAPVTYKMQPITQMHTEASMPGGDVPSINPRNIWTLLLIAAGVLLIAIINFTTLSIGRSAGRAKEVGVRKVMGSTRMHLAIQFLTEAILLSILSTIVALVLVSVLLPYFNQLSDRSLAFSFSQFPQLGWIVVCLTIITGLLAGSYPALLLSRFRPTQVFRNSIKLGGSNMFTKTLVTSQFVLSSGLVIATLVVLSQINFMQSKNPGFEKENIIIVDAEETDSREIYPRFKKLLSSIPEIKQVAASEIGLGEGNGYSRSGFEYMGSIKQIYEYYVDDDYLTLMNIPLLAGRGFEVERQDGANRSVIVNESMLTDFGWTLSDAVGQVLTGYSNEGNDPVVIGVVKDFHYRPFRELVKPQMFHQFEDYTPFKYFVKINAGDPTQALSKLEQSWTSIVPDYPFKYSFLDDDLNRFYRSEKRFSSIISWAGGISIFLACLGLMGLAALTAVNRRKEIGIRKVLGDDVFGIVGLLSKDFIKLVLIALVIASPLSWYLMNNWLESFAYRISFQWWIFVVAGIGAILIAFITISVQSIKAALINPIESLRNE